MKLHELDLGFRHAYPDYGTLTRQLRDWEHAFPEHARVQSIGTTPEGREIWVLTVGPEPERSRPAVWVDGNIHGVELAGSSVALAVAEAVLGLHVGNNGLPEHLKEQLRDVLFYICPRISPDGAERVLTRGGFVRSAPRLHPHAERAPRWQPQDMDGDGRCRFLRLRDDAGDFIESPSCPGLMLPRQPEDAPPYWRLYPEGMIENWDGSTVPEPQLLHGTPDFNRNFPWGWRPEPEQTGAGDYPGCEPETRAVIDFAVAHPNIYAWLDLHTFGGVFIRPLIDGPDSRMDQGDLAIYRQLATWGESFVGYPTVSGFEEFTYEPETPLHGDLTEFAYHQRGCLAEVCELWDLFRRIGMPPPKRFVDNYTALAREDLERLARWDAEQNQGRIFRRWHPLQHPQLGEVEVGGPDPSIGIWNPPPELLPAICEGMAAYWLRVAGLLPRLVIEDAHCTLLGSGHSELFVTVANHGYLPSYGLAVARDRPWNEPPFIEAEGDGCHLRHSEQARLPLGHLEGWGRGLGNAAHMPWFQRSRGSDNRKEIRWLVEGSGTLRIRAGNSRLGFVERLVRVDSL